MRIFSLYLLSILISSVYGQSSAIKENLGPAVNTDEDQIVPVFSVDGKTLYFSENSSNGTYEIWSSRIDNEGNWQPKQKSTELNPSTQGSKYVFAEVDKDLLLVNGRFEKTATGWSQSKGLSWYIPSQKEYVSLEIPALQVDARGRFVNAFVHLPTKTLLLSYAKNDTKDIYVCQSSNPTAEWTKLKWKKPQALPATVNSDYDDTTPFLSKDGRTLYFASNRPGGYGQEDIYSSQRLDDSWTNWTTPENLGFGVNSNYAEIYYSLSPSEGFAHFVSYKYSYGAGDVFRLQMDSTPIDVDTVLPMDSIPPVLDSIAPSIDSSAIAEVDTSTQASIPEDIAETTELSVEKYKSNNLVFLIDLSGSMRSSTKLPLVQLALKRLIEELRSIDQFTVISFADSASIRFSVQGVSDKDSLYQLIDSLVADGSTRANRGLQLGYEYTNQNFIEDGNNEIVLVTDGRFRLSEKDRQRIADNPQIILSTVGLGGNKEALKNLRKLARQSRGSFIRIGNEESGTEALLEEVKARSKR